MNKVAFTRREILIGAGAMAARLALPGGALLVEGRAHGQKAGYGPGTDPFEASAELKRLVGSIKSGDGSELDMVRKLYEKLHTSAKGGLVKQSGNGRPPRTAKEPLSAGRDCSEFALVFLSGLDMLGIKSAVLIGNVTGQKAAHVVAAAVIGGRGYLLDPQAEAFGGTIAGFDAKGARKLSRAAAGSVYHREWGDCSLDKKDYRTAVKAFGKAVTLDPMSAYCWNNLGTAYAKTGDAGMAAKCFRRAKELGGEGAATVDANVSVGDYNELVEKAKGHASKGEWKEALGLYEKALKLQPGRPIAHANVGICQLNLGNYKEAEKHLGIAYRKTKNPQIGKMWEQAKKEATASPQ